MLRRSRVVPVCAGVLGCLWVALGWVPAARAATAITTALAAGDNSAQTITFPQPPAPAYAGTSVVLNASASSGLPLTYTVISGPATVSGPTLTYTGAGTVVVEADQGGDGTVSAAAPVQNTVAVTLLTEPVGTPSVTVTTAVFISTGGTLGSVGVLTQGAPNLDFALAAGGTCTPGIVYSAGETCTVAFTFTPTRPGLRFGGTVLAAGDGTTLANSYLYGEGTGPQLIFNPGTQKAVGSGFVMAAGVALDGAGNLFVASFQAPAVSEIPSGGGPAIPLGNFTDAQDIAVDGLGNVFLVSSGRTTVNEILALNGTIPVSPVIRTLAAGFGEANGLKVDKNGNVFVASSSLNGKTDPAVYEILALNGSIPASPTIATLGSGFGEPTGVALDASGDIFVSDQINNAVYEIVAVNGSIPSSPAILQLGNGFNSPSNLALDSAGNIYVTDYGDHAVKEIQAVGGVVPAANPVITTLGSGFVEPQGLVVAANGNVFVADFGLASIAELDYADPPTLTFAATAVGATSSDSPQTVTLINDGNAALQVLPPLTGLNPAITPGFTLANSSSCPQLSALTNAAASLPAGNACTDVVSFTPVAAGPDNGTLVTTDNDLNVTGATQTVLLNATGIAPIETISLTATPSPVFLLNPVTLTATVSSNLGMPSGSVTFSDGDAVLGMATLNSGVASLVTSSLGLGSHMLTATYNSSTGPTNSAAATVVVEDFSLSFSQPTLTIAHGGTATYSLTVSPIGGPLTPAAINLAVSGAPDTSTITLSPSTVAAGTGTTTITLTIHTPDYPVGPFSENRPLRRSVVMAAAGLLLLCDRKRRLLRRKMQWIVCLALLLAASTALSGCGSGWGTQQYTVLVTGSSGPLSHTATASLTSQ